MNRLTLAILGSTIAMFTVLMVFDVHQLIQTPLSQYGVNHWIPELLAVFLFGKLLTRINKTLLPVIVGCVFLFPILTYGLANQLSFGIGTSSVFVAVLIVGIWSAKRKDVKEVKTVGGCHSG